MEEEGGESGGDGGREWCPHCRPLLSCRCCPVVILYRRRVVIVVAGISVLGWNELGMGGAHRSLFGCHITHSDVAPASLVSVGRFHVGASVRVRLGDGVIVVVFVARRFT